MRNFIMWFYGVDAAQAAAREPAACSRREGPLEGLIRRQSRRKTI